MRLRRTSLGLALGLAVAAYVLWPVRVLLLEAAPHRVLLLQALTRPVVVRLEYTHSVERTPVVEVYEAARSGLRLVRMEFVSQGAGLPSSGYRREGNRFILDADRPLSALPVRVSSVAAPRLIVGPISFDLPALVGEGGTIILSVRSRPRLAVLLRVLY